MSGKSSQAKFEKKNHLMEAYQKNYLEGAKLDTRSLGLSQIENLLFGITHAHDLLGRQIQDLSTGKSRGLYVLVVGVLSAENSILHKKIAAGARKISKQQANPNKIAEEDSVFLKKRLEPVAEELVTKEISKKKSKFIFVAKKSDEPGKVTIKECPVDSKGSDSKEGLASYDEHYLLNFSPSKMHEPLNHQIEPFEPVAEHKPTFPDFLFKQNYSDAKIKMKDERENSKDDLSSTHYTNPESHIRWKWVRNSNQIKMDEELQQQAPFSHLKMNLNENLVSSPPKRATIEELRLSHSNDKIFSNSFRKNLESDVRAL
jgi:hypothetical protein